jgi:hypothetical protein
MPIWVKGIGVLLLALIVVSVKSDYSTRVMIFIAVAAALLYLGLGKKS